jgi:hypothetical protein
MAWRDAHASDGHRARGWHSGAAVVARADERRCGEGWDPVLQWLHHAANPSRGGKEEEAHRAWLHAMACAGGRELKVAGRRSGGGKCSSGQRDMRHTDRAWGGVGRAGGGPERPGHGERNRRSDGEEGSAASGLLMEDTASAHRRWQLSTALPNGCSRGGLRRRRWERSRTWRRKWKEKKGARLGLLV